MSLGSKPNTKTRKHSRARRPVETVGLVDDRLWSLIEEAREDIRDVRSAQQDIRNAQQTDNLHLNTRIDTMTQAMATEMKSQTENLTASITNIGKVIGGKFDTVSARVGVLEKFRWQLVGANVVLGGIFALVLALFKYGSYVAKFVGLK